MTDILLVSHADIALVDHHDGSRRPFLEVVNCARLFVHGGESLALPEISFEQTWRNIHHGSDSLTISGHSSSNQSTEKVHL